MSKQYYDLLGVSETATDEEITAAFEQLKKKYSEERFLEGEKGNEAAKMLNRIDVAYNEIMTERRESRSADNASSSYAKAEQFIRDGKINEAQAVLDEFNERPAEWHYLQSVVFYKKNWMNESKKQLEIAIQMDGSNEKYRTAYNKLKEKIEFTEKQFKSGNTDFSREQQAGDRQMGGDACTSAMNLCSALCCMDMLCSCCCR